MNSHWRSSVFSFSSISRERLGLETSYSYQKFFSHFHQILVTAGLVNHLLIPKCWIFVPAYDQIVYLRFMALKIQANTVFSSWKRDLNKVFTYFNNCHEYLILWYCTRQKKNWHSNALYFALFIKLYHILYVILKNNF